MQIVIDIPKETYEKICGYSLHHIDFCYTEDIALLAIKNGTPLPKSKQTDILDKIKAEIVETQKEYCEYGWAYNDALEIIDKYREADKEV